MSKERTRPFSLRRGVIAVFLLRTTGVGFLFLMHSVLARRVGAETFGTFSYALAVTNMLTVVVSLGWPTALMRFVVQYLEQKKWSLLCGVMLRSHQIVFLSSVLVALTLWGVTYWQRLSHGTATSLYFAALLLPLFSFTQLRRKALQGLLRIKTGIVLDDVLLPLLVLGGTTFFVVTTIKDVFLLYFSATLLVFFLGSLWLWRCLSVRVPTLTTVFQTRSWMSIALPMVLGGVSQIIMNRTDVLMLGAMVDMKAVGLYTVANRISVFTVFVLSAVNTIAVPKLGAAFHGKRPKQFKMIIRKAMLLSTVSALPIFAVMIICPKSLLGFFGVEFIQGALLLKILAFGQLANAVTGPVGFALLMAGRERQFALTMAVVAGCNVIGNFLIIPKMGSIGAACVTAASLVLLNGWQFWLSRKVMD